MSTVPDVRLPPQVGGCAGGDTPASGSAIGGSLCSFTTNPARVRFSCRIQSPEEVNTGASQATPCVGTELLLDSAPELDHTPPPQNSTRPVPEKSNDFFPRVDRAIRL